jgi:hypothetical protein
VRKKKKVIELYHGAKVFTLRDKNKKFKIKIKIQTFKVVSFFV